MRGNVVLYLSFVALVSCPSAMDSSVNVGGDVLTLRNITSHGSQPRRNESSSIHGTNAQVNENGEPPDVSQPSQTYQCLLVFAGFMMTFHVIGINSIYGLFQVCL